MGDCVNLEVLIAPFTAVSGDIRVVSQWTKLQKLDLQDCKPITGDIIAFSELNELRELSLYGCVEVTGDVASFQNSHKLCELKLRHCKSVKGDVSRVCTTELRSSTLRRIRMTTLPRHATFPLPFPCRA